MLRVAVDAENLLTDFRGIARYLREILRESRIRDDIDITLLIRGFGQAAKRRRLRNIDDALDLRTSSRIPRDADVVWHPWNGTFFKTRKPSVATIHDVTPFDFPAETERRQRSQQDPIRYSAARARRILTVSEFAARRIRETFVLPRDRVVVTPLAASAPFARPPESRTPYGEAFPDLAARLAGRPYILCVSSDDQVKNFPLLADAWEQAFPARDPMLVSIGRSRDSAARHLALDRVASAESLAALYAGARIVAVPSLSESFALPVLEAMSSGVPVIASRVGAIEEIAADAALYIEDPLDRPAWIEGLRRIVEDDALRDRLRGFGLDRASRFSWRACADLTFATLLRAAGEA